MAFYKGFIIWGATAIILGILCFFLWKCYFCRVRGFENRKHTALAGCVLFYASTMTFLFLPLVLCKSSLFTLTKDRFVDGIKNDIVARTRDAFYEDAEDVLTKAVESAVGQAGERNDELERVKENVVRFALKYSKNRTIKDSLENSFKLFKNGNNNSFEIPSDAALEECSRVIEAHAAEIRADYIQNNLMKSWVAPLVKNVSMESLTGVAADEAMSVAFEKAKRAFDRLFLRFAILLSAANGTIIFIIICLLREKEEKVETEDKRKYLFEYNEESLKEMNTKKA